MNVQISKNFKKSTNKAVFSVILFILVYVIILVIAIGLTIACVTGGIFIIITKPMLFTFGLGAGLASLGFLILAFLFKFTFKKHKIDRRHLTEITALDEPKLFEFIADIVAEIDTDFPKKIYLSNEVNASVFYDSSFWSMFFPIKKNLQIGVGLVNTTTVQEFKAIMAHEFGHFSQKSMKVGSYVYNVNQVIFNMLYDNESFDKMIQKWASISGFITFFVAIAEIIIGLIQWVLKKMYDYINLNYLALSREMEFHADEVAAHVAGFKAVKESLLRMDLADHSYNCVLQFYESKIQDKIKSKNIYHEQHVVLKFLSQEYALKIENELPLVSPLDFSRFNKSKLIIKDQWASHPSNTERISYLEENAVIEKSDNTVLANSLFKNSEEIQEKMTQNIFENIENSNLLTAFSTAEFESEFIQNFEKNSFDKIYNGYYDNKNPNLFDIDSLEIVEKNQDFKSLFNPEKIDLVYDYFALNNDKNTLEDIENKNINIKTFDFEGIKFKSNDTVTILPKINSELNELETKITKNDITIYCYFHQQAAKKGIHELLKNSYKTLFKNYTVLERRQELYKNLLETTQFLSLVTPFEQIKINLDQLKTFEIELKNEIIQLLESEIMQSEIKPSSKENLENYIKIDYTYFINNQYINHELNVLMTAIHDFWYYSSRSVFLEKKSLLEFQKELL